MTCWCHQELLKRFEAEGDGFLGRIVTGDETWVHYNQPETKKASKEWRHTSSPKPKNFVTHPSAGKVLLALFWDERWVILEHCMPKGNTVTSATYADILKNHLRPAIKSKRRGRLSTGVLLQHDNARPHTARSTVATIQDLSFECLPHRPYSSDLAPQWLSCLWTAQRGDGRQVSQVRRRGAAGGAGVAALSAKRFLFFSPRDINALPKRWNACMERNGDYIEKWSHCVPFMFNKLRDKKNI